MAKPNQAVRDGYTSQPAQAQRAVATPPAAPFLLKQGVTITDPARWWRDTIADIAAGPGVRRDHYGAVKSDLMRIWEMFGPRAVPTTEQ